MTAQWQEGRYGLYTLLLTRGIEVHVIWDSCIPKNAPEEKRGYQVSCVGRELSARFKSFEEAKRAGENFARKILYEALDALGEGEQKAKN